MVHAQLLAATAHAHLFFATTVALDFYATRHRPVRCLVSGLVWASSCWFIVREKHCWLAGLGWLKPTSEQAATTSHSWAWRDVPRTKRHNFPVISRLFVGSTPRHRCSRHANFVGRLVDGFSRAKTRHTLWYPIFTPQAVAPLHCTTHRVANDGCHPNSSVF